MDIKEFSELERRYEQAKTNRAIGAFIGGGGVFALLADFLWDVANPISIGVLIGGGLVFFAVCHEQVRSSLRKLDEECYLKYGKSYSQSFHEIFKDKYK